jgi:hypothetical protein
MTPAQCALPECEKPAMISRAGRQTLYCSHNHGQQAYARRQRQKVQLEAMSHEELTRAFGARFWKRIVYDGPLSVVRPDLSACWLWRGAHGKSQYAQTSLYGVVLYVHRVIYRLVIGLIPESYEIDHLCRHRPCVNPHHFEAVTPLENLQREAVARGKPATCTHGHAFIPENRGAMKNGSTYCLRCSREGRRKRA